MCPDKTLNKGILYLIPTTVGESGITKVIPDFNLHLLKTIDEFIVEEIKTARRFLKKAGYAKPFDDVTFHLLNKRSRPEEITSYLNSVFEGKNIGLLSEAGMPCVADPGASVVQLAHERGIRVIPLVGPSSILLALAASGFNGQSFAFHGYLPIDTKACALKLKELEKNISQNQTQIFIETPYRNIRLFENILRVCNQKNQLCIACDLTLENEYIRMKSIARWKKETPPIHKRNAVFLLYH
jgi:16S rRNA (cytidine1402-2'-O)-methyltransferase